MKLKYKGLSIIALFLLVLISCKQDLDLEPTNDITADRAYNSLQGYKQVLAKVYGAYALTGNGVRSSDLGGIDAGNSDFLRLYWNLQEMPTDEAVNAWGDRGLVDLQTNTWTSDNVQIQGLYTRSLYQITVANAFLRETTDEKIGSRGLSAEAEQINYFAAEARFIRAFQYWVLLDIFGNPPFVTEQSPIGKNLPPQTSRKDLFNYIESELLAIEPLMVNARQNEYGRADKAAVWALLARLYLNAEVYTGEPKYTEAITYASRVINAGYSLMPQYRNLFRADNHLNNNEVILSINYDGVNSQNFGGTTFLVNAAIKGDWKAEFGLTGPEAGWAGNHSRDNLPALFTNANDKRAMFKGNDPKMDDYNVFDEGLAVAKWNNLTSDDKIVPGYEGRVCSIDFPLFRLAEMYLIYAEAVKRGGSGGNEGTAVNYLNLLRQRAYGNTSGNISAYTLNDIIDERGRELYWEGFRRTDLIRFNRFSEGTYLWPFKGGVKAGREFSADRKLYPLPASDISSNPNLTQNKGY
ncbi:RagB/SusD family nutrient uptake outer membrane protein [Pedobacter sp. SYSU D00535]|uniref:RagB/SusD family nutrient uptake outer membrane protein n=1 Tax=Pedobacter sp. SYSU D00535 TaxID=2810308 RepID=UPI001A95FBB7|nr:RagB/SusD family nutrient uptake outer membrane protein [Pedobacter sp. SYSU D00535]